MLYINEEQMTRYKKTKIRRTKLCVLILIAVPSYLLIFAIILTSVVNDLPRLYAGAFSRFLLIFFPILPIICNSPLSYFMHHNSYMQYKKES